MGSTSKIKNLITSQKEEEFVDLLRLGLDPNLEGGWPIRLAARYGCSKIVETLLQFGANPHLPGNSGASTLQLAVFSGEHWNTDRWMCLLSCCDSSQLADGAAVAIIFRNVEALKKIMDTGRCNTNISTTLTGQKLEHLAKCYKLTHLLDTPSTTVQNCHENFLISTPRTSRRTRDVHSVGTSLTAHHTHRNLSPSVARFFHQTAGQSTLSPSRRTAVSECSPRKANS